MRVKEHLRARGVEFDAVNVYESETARSDLSAQRLLSLPVIARGETYLHAGDFRQVDEFLGLANTGRPAAGLSAHVLGHEATFFLSAARRWASQLPPSELGRAIPGMEASAPGSMQQRTALDLVDHIARHGQKIVYLATTPETTELRDPGWSTRILGPPTESSGSLDGMLAELQHLEDGIASWSRMSPDADLDITIETHYGSRRRRDVLSSQLSGLAQHARQLVDLLARAGMAADPRLDASHLDDLHLPASIWGE